MDTTKKMLEMCAYGDGWQLEDVLKTADIHAHDDAALASSARRGDSEIAALLVQYGADPTARKGEMMMSAVEGGFHPIVELFLPYFSDPDWMPLKKKWFKHAVSLSFKHGHTKSAACFVPHVDQETLNETMVMTVRTNSSWFVNMLLPHIDGQSVLDSLYDRPITVYQKTMVEQIEKHTANVQRSTLLKEIDETSVEPVRRKM